MLLRRFYVQENEKGMFLLLPRTHSYMVSPIHDVPSVLWLTLHPAPEPKQKKNRELKTEILPVTVPVTTPPV